MINPIDAVNPATYPFNLESLPRIEYWPRAGNKSLLAQYGSPLKAERRP